MNDGNEITEQYLDEIERRANRVLLDPAESYPAKITAREAIKYAAIERRLRREPDVLPDEEELS